MVRSFSRALFVLLAFGMPVAVTGAAQEVKELASISRAPRFLVPGTARGEKPVEVDAARIDVAVRPPQAHHQPPAAAGGEIRNRRIARPCEPAQTHATPV